MLNQQLIKIANESKKNYNKHSLSNTIFCLFIHNFTDEFRNYKISPLITKFSSILHKNYEFVYINDSYTNSGKMDLLMIQNEQKNEENLLIPVPLLSEKVILKLMKLSNFKIEERAYRDYSQDICEDIFESDNYEKEVFELKKNIGCSIGEFLKRMNEIEKKEKKEYEKYWFKVFFLFEEKNLLKEFIAFCKYVTNTEIFIDSFSYISAKEIESGYQYYNYYVSNKIL